ncbi:MAG: RpiB/LacA/LacB family sugar-phosphate isomerase [Rickettsiales bacterium]|jgi:ribose 5-phosphate isomerase B|nr:RpiB/LacA/LacB family sugar-phosphate isomerase [Rickettsiales bacterium]
MARRLAIASDHGGFALKRYIARRMECVDLGPENDAPVDYPDYAAKVVDFVAGNPGSMGVLACRTGTGMMIAANRDRRVRAALLYSRMSAIKARTHEDANVAVLAAGQFSRRQNLAWLRVFLETPFPRVARHMRRIKKIS